MQWLRTKSNFHPFWLTLLAPLLIGVTLHWSMKKLIATTHRVTHTHQVLEELDDIPLQLGRADTAHYDYVLTGDGQYLTAYQTAAHATQKEIEDVRPLIEENQGQQKRLAAVEDLAHERLRQLQQTIDVRRTDGFDAALQAIAAENGADLTGSIDALIQEMESEAWRLLASWSTAANASAHQLDALIAGGSVMALLLLIVANFLILWHAVERTQAETARRASAERYRSLFESAHDGIVLSTSDETVTDVNRAFERMTGWTQQELLGHRLRTLFPPASAIPEPGHAPADALEPQSGVQTRLRRKDGSMLAVKAWVNFFRDSNGNPIGVQGIYRDLSEQIPATASVSARRQPSLVAEATISGH
jgi:PAS domain S-box-containing protein